jgi:WS/DGAT/MGAT family acyltransferase
MAKGSGASLNDIVLAICAGALKRYLADYNFKPDRPLVAGVPVSLRETGNTDPNNQVSMMMVSLATDIEDPLARLHAIHTSANIGKKLTGSFKAAMPTDFPSLGVPWLMSGFASLYGRSRLAERLPPIINVAISNVPGPQHPLYFAGAKLAGFYPVSIPAHGVALNMTVQSYNGALEVGLTACRRAMPDVTDLADHVVQEFEMLRGLIDALAVVVPAAVVTDAAPVHAAAPQARKVSAPGKVTKVPINRRRTTSAPAVRARSGKPVRVAKQAS